jgi:hypothetical protein
MLIVTVIEAGSIEQQVCVLAESIRLAGGPFSSSSILAVIPRRGPPLSSSTKATLRRLNVELATIRRSDALTWFQFLNKTHALDFAAKRFKGRIAWLDADILCMNEPAGLAGPAQFAASATDKNIGTSGCDEQAPYFRSACAALGIDFDSLPYVTTEREKLSIKCYWNSGVFSFDSSTDLAATHHDFTRRLVEKRIGSPDCGIYMSDQVSLGLAVHALGLSVNALPLSHNYNIQPIDCEKELATPSNISILHYHGCMWPASFEALMTGVASRNASIGDLLKRYGPLSDQSTQTKIVRKLLELYRGINYRLANSEAVSLAKNP